MINHMGHKLIKRKAVSANLREKYQNGQDYEVMKQVSAIINNRKKNNLKKLIQNYQERNYPLYHSQKCSFGEQWEKYSIVRTQEVSHLFFKQSSTIFFIINLIMLIFFGVLAWYASVRRVFEFQDVDLIFSLKIGQSLGSILVFSYAVFKKRLSAEQINFKEKYQFGQQIYSIIYCILISANTIDEHWTLIILDLLFIYIQWIKLSEIYGFFRKILISSKYRSQLNLTHMLITLCIFGHLFSIILFSCTYIEPENNWTQKLSIEITNFWGKYIGSIYFSMTTMLTVGYGDLSPVNSIEFLIIVVIQIIGVVIFAYVVNQIGSTLSQIRKHNLALQSNISLLQHLSNYYGLGQDLTLKARDYLSTNQQTHAQINSQDQNNLLNKLNEQLREEIAYQTNYKLMDHSIFFICYWNKNFRNYIASKLIKKILSPNEVLIQTPSNQSIYIIQKGTIKILAEKYCRAKCCVRKNVKTLMADLNQEQVLNNVFGYSFSLTERPIRLSAVASDTVVSYILSKKDFIQSIKQESQNIQYYHELRHRIEQLKVTQAFEARDILSYRQHYYPNIHFLLFKDRKKGTKQRRSKKLRSSKRMETNSYTVESLSQFLSAGLQYTMENQNKSNQEIGLNCNSTNAYHNSSLFENFENEREYKNFFKKSNFTEVKIKMGTKNIGWKRRNPS